MKAENCKLKIISNPNLDVVTSQAIEALNTSFKEHINIPLLFLVSAGSAFKLLDGINSQFLGVHVTISVLDERYSEEPSINNFGQLMKIEFYEKASEKGCQFIDTHIKNHETMEQLNNRFELFLKNWKSNNPNGYILITQSIGPDGHTSGIMPFPENVQLFNEIFNNKNKWVVGYDAGNKNQFPLRVTTTIPFLKNIVDESIIYIVGENKKEALKNILNIQLPITNENIAEIPGRVIHQMRDVKVFTDQLV